MALEESTDLSNELPIGRNTCTAIVIQPVTVTALLVGVHVDSPTLASRPAHQVQPLIQFAQLQGDTNTCSFLHLWRAACTDNNRAG